MSSFVVMGVDVSTRTGLAVINVTEGSTEFDVVDSCIIQGKPEPNRMNRWAGYVGHFTESCEEHNPDLIVFEGYGFANAHTLATLVEVGALLRYTANSRGHRWVEVPPNSLKKFATGKGNAKKSLVLQQLLNVFDLETDDEDIGDAIVAALFGGQHLGAELVRDKLRKSAVESWSAKTKLS